MKTIIHIFHNYDRIFEKLGLHKKNCDFQFNFQSVLAENEFVLSFGLDKLTLTGYT